MRAVRIYAKEDARLEDLPEPNVGDSDVLLKGGYSGICGTDLHLYFAPDSFPWDFTKPAILTGAKWPAILGHEFSGEVATVGRDANGLQVGDRVAVFPYYVCGECPSCGNGESTLCWNMAFDGIQGRSGGMSETRVVPASHCFVLPDNVDLRMGALVEPMAVAWRGVREAEPLPGDAVLILGGGPIGVGVYFALKAHDIETVVVSEPSPQRRSVLQRLGVPYVLDPTEIDVAAEVFRLTGGHGAAVVLDCAGVPQAFDQGLAALGMGGTMMILATYEKPISLNPTHLTGHKSVRNSVVYDREDFASVINAMERGLYDIESGWVTVVELDEAVASLTALRDGLAMKILVAV